MSKELVKLPKEVVAQLDWINRNHDYPVRVVVDVFNGQVYGDLPILAEYFEADRSRRITLITQALVNGYEIEETPEDKVRKLYKEYDGWAEQAGLNGDENLEMQWIAARNAIVETLSILNIKIEGVNA